MPSPYSTDLRWRIVRAMEKPGTTYEDVAERFEVGRATVNRWGRLYRETGDVEPRPHAGHPPRKLDEQGELVVLELVSQSPDATVGELADETSTNTKIQVSRATNGRSLAKHGLTRKKVGLRQGTAHGTHRGAPRALVGVDELHRPQPVGVHR